MRYVVLLLVTGVLIAGCSDGSGRPVPNPDREFGHGSQWIDEPLPTIGDFTSPSSCTDLYRMLVGVQNERFRLKTDVTATEDAELELTHWDFPEYEVFSDLQADMDCSDAELGDVIQNSTDARCHRWVLDGHHLEEDPLMLNTAQCFG